MAKSRLKHCQIIKISESLYKIDVADNDGDKRFPTGSRNNHVSVHTQRKMAKNVF